MLFVPGEVVLQVWQSHPGLAVDAERVAGEAELLRLLLLAVERSEKGAALEREDGLRVFRVAEFPSSMSVTAGLENASRGVDRVEAVLGIGGQRPREGLELRGDGVAVLVGLVLEDGDVAVSMFR